MQNVGEGADRKDEGGGPQVQRAGDQPLVIERLGEHHRIAEFCCRAKAKTDRVERFLRNQAGKYEGSGFARFYIASPKADPGKVFGYYSLSATAVRYGSVKLSGSQQKKVPGHIDFPMAKLGYMGKADDCPVRGLGELLIVDAAKRLTSVETLGVWGIILDAELGDPDVPDFKPNPDTDRLVRWYRERGFESLADQVPDSHTHAMFAKLEWLYRPEK
jgi:hypothetical protein